MDSREAALRDDALLDETLGAVEPQVVWTHNITTKPPCRDALNNDHGQSVTRARAVLTVISAGRKKEFFRQIAGIWKEKGYKVSSVNRSRMPSLHVRTKDGFTLELLIGAHVQAHFRASSGCAEDTPVPKPTSKTDGLTSRGVPRKPYIKDEYWSSEGAAPRT